MAAILPFSAAAGPLGLTIQVFQLCNGSGVNCASLGPAGDLFYAAETNKIWAQAGISVSFQFVQQIDSTKFSTIDDTSGSGHTFGDLAGTYGTHGPSSTIVDMFLVHPISGAYGESWFDAGGLVIGMDDVMAFNAGDPAYPNGRIDTIAHELGHNLGLVPASLGGDAGAHSSNPNYLMASGGIRNVPGTSADIAPDGLNLDQIPADQIAYARQSGLLAPDSSVPEPGYGVLAAVISATFILVRRRKG